MPTLDWIGKKAVVNHHREVPYRLVHCDGDLSAGDPDAGNLLVQGDNLEALKALLPYYAGKVKCIYIDPPYNTGNEGWVYNDNVASPEIKAWLGKVVGKEAEDLSRHDKWLCMMYPRLRLLREFLREDGVIFISIGDDEVRNLHTVLHDVFGNNFVSTLIWVNEGNIDNQSKIKQNHEYVVAFARHKSLFEAPSLVDPNIDADSKLSNKHIRNTIVKNGPKNPVSRITLPVGFPANFESGVIRPPIDDRFWPKFENEIKVENWQVTNEVNLTSGWSSKAICEAFIADRFNDVIDRKGQPTRFYLTESGALFNEKDRTENQSHVLSVMFNMGSVQASSDELEELGVAFPYPKPRKLISYLLRMVCQDGDLILDSFAGSGTTGHAVLDLNKQDGGNRKFILVEMDETIAPDITAQRLTRVINGYDKGGDASKPVEGLGGGFRYCRLGVPLFNEFGDIDGGVTFPDLAAHVFFAECGVPIPAKAHANSPLLGQYQDKAVYLLFSPSEPGFAREASGNVLTPDVLASLPMPDGFTGQRVVYGEGCTLSRERLTEAGVIFKQIPYQIDGN